MYYTEIPTNEIKFFLRRARRKSAYSRLKQSIRKDGLQKPIQVRKLDKPTSSGQNYELICGQGRLQAFREIPIPTIPAIVLNVSEEEIVGRFLAENVMRKRLSWYEKAQLIKRDVDKGMSLEDIKDKYSITIPHAQKYLKVLGRASDQLIDDLELDKLSINQAEELTSLEGDEQSIVLDALREEGLDRSQIKHLVSASNEVKQTGQKLTKEGLINILNQEKHELQEVRKRHKSVLRFWRLGPQNLNHMMQDADFLRYLDQEQINYKPFLQLLQNHD